MNEPPHPVDIHIGKKLKETRCSKGLSQRTLAGCINVSYQQLQKFENGQNRISASALWVLSKSMGVPIRMFYDGFDENLLAEKVIRVHGKRKRTKAKTMGAKQQKDI